MADTVKITIDEVEYEVPAGMNLVDAAKRYAGNDVPVFCYHPKLGHDGNCRMCLVELALPRKNPQTGEMETAWFPNLQTACTQKTTEGMVVRTLTDKVIEGRKEILEYLLSSHPLDCPICDKGGECPLQNLTMAHGPGTSRMYWEEKMHLGKHVPLGELIFLDQERCIHCARCIRFQDQIAGDHVLDFDDRGRHQRIITNSDPGFDSIFSGNTTDICPVGALTTADFRFNARPWEMVQVASICTHCPVGCNVNFDTRTDREAGGRTTIKRVMPRQNEQVNEVWICDKGRFAHHYMEHPDRLTTPLVRKSGKLVEATWDEALDKVAAELKSAGADAAAIAGGRLSNEDYFVLQGLIRAQGSDNLAPYPDYVGGGELAAQVGVGVGTNLLGLGRGDAILVAASDLHEEAPVWWLRVRAAAGRGATLIVVNGRGTRLDDNATHTIRCDYGEEIATLNAILGAVKPPKGHKLDGLEKTLKHAAGFKADKPIKAAADAISKAANVVVMVGGEGLAPRSGDSLARAAANLLLASGHYGRPNNGLIIVWPTANGQGASDMGFRPDFQPGYKPVKKGGMGYDDTLIALARNKIKAVYIAGADPAYDDAAAAKALHDTRAFVIVQEMFLTATAELADVVLPTQSMAEREGTYTNGERRVQRLYPAVEPTGEGLPDWEIVERIADRLGYGPSATSAVRILQRIAEDVPQYAGITYQKLAEVVPQFPDVGGDDLYYGGTAFQNYSGLGVQWPTAAETSAALALRPAEVGKPVKARAGEWVVVPVTLLYDTETVFFKTDLLHERIAVPHVAVNPADARTLKVLTGDTLALKANGQTLHVAAYLDERIPKGTAALPRRLAAGATLPGAAAGSLKKVERVRA